MAKFQPGDKAVFINDAGINFGEKTIVSMEQNPVRGETYYIAPTDTPWFATGVAHLFHPEDKAGIEAATAVHY